MILKGQVLKAEIVDMYLVSHIGPNKASDETKTLQNEINYLCS